MAEPLYRGYSSQGARSPDTAIFDVDLVKQDLLNHFQTRLGERLGRPGFGSIIHDLLFDVGDTRTDALVQKDAERIISQDPRVELLEIDVTVNHDIGSIVVDLRLRYVQFDMDSWFSVAFSQQLDNGAAL